MRVYLSKKITILFLLLSILCNINSICRADEIKAEQSNKHEQRIMDGLQHLIPRFLQTAKQSALPAGLLPPDSFAVLNFIETKNIKNIKPQIFDITRYPSLASIPNEGGIFLPRNINEVRALIEFANSYHFKIRTAGSAHSPSAAIYDQSNLKQIVMVLEGDLRKLHSIAPDVSGEFAIVKVGAGCNLGVNPNNKNSTLKNSFDYQVDQAGFALPTLGGISHQTIAGFLLTSSSGGTSKHNIADVIEEIEWIDGMGRVHRAKKDEDEFNAVVVSMGLMGVITEITLKLPRKFLVEGVEINHELKDSFLVKDERGHYTKLQNALFKENEYIHINWLPQKYVNRTMEWTGHAVQPTGPIQPYQHTLNSKLMTFLARVAFRIGNLIDTFGWQNDDLLKIKAEILKLFCVPEEKQVFRDVWYKTLPIDDQADVDGKVKTLFSELWFPQNKVDEVMQKLEELFAENPQAAGNFIVELYCAKQSPYWLSPSYGTNSFRVDLYWWNQNIGDPNKYFGIFWNKLLGIEGARLHWGKYLPIPGKQYGANNFLANQFSQTYPKFAAWSKIRKEMDPNLIFVTSYWQKVLDIK